MLSAVLSLILAGASPEFPPMSLQETTAPADKKAGQKEVPGQQGDQKKLPRSKQLPVWVAACIGAGGSLVYLLAVYLGFVGKDEEARGRILAHFLPLCRGNPSDPARTQWSFRHAWAWIHIVLMVLLYLGGGAFVAYVFQLTEPELVPIQAFVLGCTWPAIVANYISARQTGDGVPPADKPALAEVGSISAELDNMKDVVRNLEEIKTSASVPAAEEIKKKLDGVLDKLKGQPTTRSSP